MAGPGPPAQEADLKDLRPFFSAGHLDSLGLRIFRTLAGLPAPEQWRRKLGGSSVQVISSISRATTIPEGWRQLQITTDFLNQPETSESGGPGWNRTTTYGFGARIYSLILEGFSISCNTL